MSVHLAQVNLGLLKEPLTAPAMADFAAALEVVNRLGEESPGYVWRFQSPAGMYGDGGNPLELFNLTVWRSIEELKSFTYRGMHGKFFAQRATWFERVKEMQYALWWIPEGTCPAPEEARLRLAHLRRHGPTPWAFTFQVTFAPDAGLAAQPKD